MSTPTSGYRFLAVSFHESYGTKRIVAEVWSADHDHENPTRDYGYKAVVQSGPFGGYALEGFELAAYAGHDRLYGDDKDDDLWGLEAQFSSYSVRLHDAKRYVSVLAALDKRAAKMADEDGHPQSYAEWLARMAKILGCTRIRVWVPDGYAARKLGPTMRLSEGAATVERAARAWASGTARDEALKAAA